jgi:hypothetical protein
MKSHEDEQQQLLESILAAEGNRWNKLKRKRQLRRHRERKQEKFSHSLSLLGLSPSGRDTRTTSPSTFRDSTSTIVHAGESQARTQHQFGEAGGEVERQTPIRRNELMEMLQKAQADFLWKEKQKKKPKKGKEEEKGKEEKKEKEKAEEREKEKENEEEKGKEKEKENEKRK